MQIGHTIETNFEPNSTSNSTSYQSGRALHTNPETDSSKSNLNPEPDSIPTQGGRAIQNKPEPDFVPGPPLYFPDR